jgi:hypothetical protein
MTRERLRAASAGEAMKEDLMGASALRIAACVAAAVLADSPAMLAQRFDAAKREAVTAIPGLDVVTIRDTSLNVCYTLFILEPAVQPAASAPADARSIQDLAHERDRQLAAVIAEYERSQYATVPGFPVPTLRYSWEGTRVQSEYERKLREKDASRLEEQLAHLASVPRLAVAGPVPCAPSPGPKK